MSPSEICRELGRILSRGEARGLSERLETGETLTMSLREVSPGKRVEVRRLLMRLAVSHEHLSMMLRGIEGAHSVRTIASPRWTMPGHLAKAGPLTTSVVDLIARATHSITCSTFNFQPSSVLWNGLRQCARRLGKEVRLYLDSSAADNGNASHKTTTVAIADWLSPAVVLRTKAFDDRPVRNHAKFIIVDHRFVLVTSANFSLSAERNNVEFGLQVDDQRLAESIERQMHAVEPHLYEMVAKSP